MSKASTRGVKVEKVGSCRVIKIEKIGDYILKQPVELRLTYSGNLHKLEATWEDQVWREHSIGSILLAANEYLEWLLERHLKGELPSEYKNTASKYFHEEYYNLVVIVEHDEERRIRRTFDSYGYAIISHKEEIRAAINLDIPIKFQMADGRVLTKEEAAKELV